MKPEVKAAWIQALKSGEYKQGHGGLKSSNEEFCCLGVLCDISKLGEWKATYPGYPGYQRYIVNNIGDSCYLTDAVKYWAGMDGLSNTTLNELIRLNDSKTPFATIADVIEAEL